MTQAEFLVEVACSSEYTHAQAHSDFIFATGKDENGMPLFAHTCEEILEKYGAQEILEGASRHWFDAEREVLIRTTIQIGHAERAEAQSEAAEQDA